jgi:uncharacterized Zn finger protein
MHTLDYEIDCTTCGCPDVEVEREARGDGWFADGIARCNECGQTFCFRAPKDQPEPADSTVEYLPECPKCGSTDVPAQRSLLPVRYRKCQACDHTFKGIVKRKPK